MLRQLMPECLTCLVNRLSDRCVLVTCACQKINIKPHKSLLLTLNCSHFWESQLASLHPWLQYATCISCRFWSNSAPDPKWEPLHFFTTVLSGPATDWQQMNEPDSIPCMGWPHCSVEQLNLLKLWFALSGDRNSETTDNLALLACSLAYLA